MWHINTNTTSTSSQKTLWTWMFQNLQKTWGTLWALSAREMVKEWGGGGLELNRPGSERQGRRLWLSSRFHCLQIMTVLATLSVHSNWKWDKRKKVKVQHRLGSEWSKVSRTRWGKKIYSMSQTFWSLALFRIREYWPQFSDSHAFHIFLHFFSLPQITAFLVVMKGFWN